MLQKETEKLKVQVEKLEEAVRKNIKTTSEATSGVKESIREEFNSSQKSLKNVISQFKENVTEEIVTTMNQYQTAVVDKFQNDSSSIAR